eukprot:6214342-Pleurochrysis_carterae.AAC.1
MESGVRSEFKSPEHTRARACNHAHVHTAKRNGTRRAKNGDATLPCAQPCPPLHAQACEAMCIIVGAWLGALS